MHAAQCATREGGTVTVPAEAVQTFAAALRGELFETGAPGYDAARALWNAMVERRPALIARCSGVADVMAAVSFATEHDLRLAVRGGGHNVAGSASADGALVIDCSAMRQAAVDPAARRAHVGPGATLGDLDHETQAFGLVTPTGINSTTGVAGLTLGGGFGWLSRRFGMTIDNLVAADVVTAGGQMIRANAHEHEDLFWALRGGGGNFGVVTRFEFALHPFGPDALSGLIVYPIARARGVLEKYRDLMRTLPDESSVWVVMRRAPPLPFLPAEAHGTPIIALAVLHAGDAASGERLLEKLRAFAPALGEHFGVQPFTAWQTAFDPLLAPGERNYWKSHNFSSLPDEALDALLAAADSLQLPQCELFLAALGGEVARVPAGDTAYAHRDAAFVVNVHGRWSEPADDGRGVAWVRACFDSLSGYATGGVYVNFLSDGEVDRVPAAYGSNYQRLVEVKRTYDPDNVFRSNQNVRPDG